MKYVLSAMGTSTRYGPITTSMTVRIVDADSEDAALGKASRMARRAYPYSKGWNVVSHWAQTYESACIDDVETVSVCDPRGNNELEQEDPK